MSKPITSIPELVTVDWLLEHLNHDNLIVLDATISKIINEDSESISGARFFDIKGQFSDLNATFPSTLPKATQFEEQAQLLGINQSSFIVVYDEKGIYSSARAWWLLKAFGHKHVAVLDGGLPEWLERNYPVSILDQSSVKRGNFKAYYRPNCIVDFSGIQECISKPEVVILDARSKDRFLSLVDEPRKGLRRGHIPGSRSLPYTELLHDNKLKPVNELSTFFNTLVKAEKRLVFSCGSGITACILALGAKLCDYDDIAVYDGSWTEYGTLINKE
ncbi:sulfurtransferase [Winogradskyella poriferorum]|uniref:sulfurtransferase n=1 Tax=Winogradskyella poriferorum TaxID=307627 RepID=UPI003D66146F